MIGPKPKFMDSPFFVPEFGNWHLLPGAPQEVIDEFKEFMKLDEEIEKAIKKAIKKHINDK